MKKFLLVFVLLGLSGCSGMQEEIAQNGIMQEEQWLGGSIIVGNVEYRAWEVWEHLIDGPGGSNFNVGDMENAVYMKHLQLDDRYLLWWFDEHGREVGIGDVARMQ